MSPRWRRPGCVALLAATAMAACYDMRSTRLRVRIPTTRLDCIETTNRTFADAGFARVEHVQGPGFFFTPRTAPTASQALALRWGIGVWMDANSAYRDQQGCDFELQALSTDEDCGMQCPLTPQPGAEYDRIVQDLAKRLDAAFGERRTPE
jgi:hypothetical protein